MAGNGDSLSENPVYCGDGEFVEVNSPTGGEASSTTEEQLKEAVDLQEATSSTSDMSERVQVEEIDARVSGDSEGSCCCSFVDSLPPTAHVLIYWRNATFSGAVLASVLGFLLMMRCCGVLTVMSLLGLCILTVSFVHRLLSAVMGKFTSSPIRNPFQNYLDVPLNVPDKAVEEYTRVIAKGSTRVLVELRRLFAVADIPDSVKFGLLLWLAYHITSMFNFITLLIIGVLVLFTLPKIYEDYKVQINQCIAGVMGQAMALFEKAKSSPYVGAAINHVLPPKDKQS